LKHIDKLAEYVTSLDARIGYANEHIGKTFVEEIKSPIYATGVGLVIKGLLAEEERIAISNSKDESGRKKAESNDEGKSGVGFLKRLVEKGKNWLNDDKDLSDF
jgi:cell division protein FtsA